MIRLIPCQSTSIQAIGYEPGHTHFYVQFKNGTFYEYDVGQEATEHLTDILFADSQGKAFDSFKHAGFSYSKVEHPEELDFHV